MRTINYTTVFFDLKYVRQNKEMGSYVIKWLANKKWPTVIITSALLYEMATHKIAIYYRLAEVLGEGPTTKVNIPPLRN